MNLKDVSLGLWIDDAPKTVLNEGYFRALADCNIDCIAIMIDGSDRQWKSSWSPKQIEWALKLADPHAMEVVLTTWPYPDYQQILAMAKDLRVFMKLGPIAAWESDLEFNWRTNKVVGFKNLDLAGDFFVKTAREVCGESQARFEVTSFTEHTENGSKADVVPHCDRFLVQAYSISTRPGGQSIPWGHTYAPGNMQKFTLDRTLLVPGIGDGHPQVGCGLAAWSQSWPNHTPDEAMKVALDKVLEYEVIDIRWWSSKHVLGHMRNSFAAKFLKDLR